MKDKTGRWSRLLQVDGMAAAGNQRGHRPRCGAGQPQGMGGETGVVGAGQGQERGGPPLGDEVDKRNGRGEADETAR